MKGVGPSKPTLFLGFVFLGLSARWHRWKRECGDFIHILNEIIIKGWKQSKGWFFFHGFLDLVWIPTNITFLERRKKCHLLAIILHKEWTYTYSKEIRNRRIKSPMLILNFLGVHVHIKYGFLKLVCLVLTIQNKRCSVICTKLIAGQ